VAQNQTVDLSQLSDEQLYAIGYQQRKQIDECNRALEMIDRVLATRQAVAEATAAKAEKPAEEVSNG
jgi:hypothetical protein